MRNDQACSSTHQLTVKNNVQIDRSGIPSNFTLPTELLLCFLEQPEDLPRCVIGLKCCDGVEEGLLALRATYWRGFK